MESLSSLEVLRLSALQDLSPPSLPLWLLLGAVLLLAGPALLLLRPWRPRALPLPPGPRPWPVVGSIPLIASDPLPYRVLARLARRYGPAMCVRVGGRPVLVASSPAAAREVLREADGACCDRPGLELPGILSYGGQNVVFAAAGPHLKRVRKLLAVNMLTKRNIELLKHVRLEEAQQMCDAVTLEAAAQNGLVKLRSHIKFASINHVMRAAIGKSFQHSLPGQPNEEGDKFIEWVEEAFLLVGALNISDFLPFFKPFDLTGFAKKARELHVRMSGFFRARLDEHRERLAREIEKGEKDSLVRDLCDAMLMADESDRVGDEAMLGVLTDIVIGASDTTAVTVEWIMLELIRHPDKLLKLQKEVDNAFEKGEADELESRLIELPYLRAVVKETLRLHVPLPLLVPHQTTERVTVGNGKYSVPAGTMVQVNVWAITHDPQVWPEPFDFKPERFLEQDVDFRGSDFRFLPFGAGRRMCPGITVGNLMSSLMVAHLVHGFDWTAGSEPIDNREKMGLSLTPLKPLEAVATPRK